MNFVPVTDVVEKDQENKMVLQNQDRKFHTALQKTILEGSKTKPGPHSLKILGFPKPGFGFSAGIVVNAMVVWFLLLP